MNNIFESSGRAVVQVHLSLPLCLIRLVEGRGTTDAVYVGSNPTWGTIRISNRLISRERLKDTETNFVCSAYSFKPRWPNGLRQRISNPSILGSSPSRGTICVINSVGRVYPLQG